MKSGYIEQFKTLNTESVAKVRSLATMLSIAQDDYMREKKARDHHDRLMVEAYDRVETNRKDLAQLMKDIDCESIGNYGWDYRIPSLLAELMRDGGAT